MYVLDTDMWSLLTVNHPRVAARRRSILTTEIALSIITRIEVLQGRFAFLLKAADGDQLLRAHQFLEATERELARVHKILPIDTRAAAEFDRLLRDRKLRKIGRADLLIAAITIAQRATLVTRNLKHFRLIPGLNLDNWAD